MGLGASSFGSNLGRVDDGGEVLDAKHSKVADGERAPDHLSRGQPALLGPSCQRAHLQV